MMIWGIDLQTWTQIGQAAGTTLGATLGSAWATWQARKQERWQLEWQSRVLEEIARDSGSIPPPRQRLTTLTGTAADKKMWADIVAAAKRENRLRGKE